MFSVLKGSQLAPGAAMQSTYTYIALISCKCGVFLIAISIYGRFPSAFIIKFPVRTIEM